MASLRLKMLWRDQVFELTEDQRLEVVDTIQSTRFLCIAVYNENSFSTERCDEFLDEQYDLEQILKNPDVYLDLYPCDSESDSN